MRATTASVRTRVVFVGGHGRSGSTLVGRVLETQPGVFHAGELQYLWSRGLRANNRCGCGERFHECPFWMQVGETAFNGWHNVDADEAIRVRRATTKTKDCFALAAPGLVKGSAARIQRYAELLDPLYQAISAVSGATTVVDSSKLPQSAYMLRRLPDVDLRLLHLVRSPYAVVHAWSSAPKPRLDADPGEMMRTFAPRVVAAEWQAYNVLLAGLSRLSVPTVVVRFEDFVEDAVGEFTRMLCLLDRAAPAGDHVCTGSVTLGPGHGISGNPNRFQNGVIPLRLDERWRTEMTPALRRQVSVLTAPLRWRYGYLTRGQPQCARARG